MTPEQEIKSLREAYCFCESVFLMKEMDFHLEQLYHIYPSILRSRDYLKLMKPENTPELTISDGMFDAKSFYTSNTNQQNYDNLTITVNSPSNNNFWTNQ
jgi:hypothetical protein